MYINELNLSPLVVAEPVGYYQSPSTTAHEWVEVLVNVPHPSSTDETEEKLYTYRIPNQLEVKPGDIVTVPFNSQQLGGIVIRFLAQPPIDLPLEKIWDLEAVIHRGFFRDNYSTLLEKVSQYYYTPLIQVIRTALPPKILVRSQSRIRLTVAGAAVITNTNTSDPWLSTPLMRAFHQPQSRLIKLYLLNAIGKNFFINILALLIFSALVPNVQNPEANKILQLLQQQTDGDYSMLYLQRQFARVYAGLRHLSQRGLVETYIQIPRMVQPKLEKAVILVGSTLDRDLTNRQREILEVLRRHGGELWQSELLQTCRITASVLKTMVQKGCLVIEEKEVLRSEQNPDVDGDHAKSLTPTQAHALAKIQSLDGYAEVLLHGVTGSGKTEVYLQAIAPLLNQGKSALVLVPEIGLTPQLTDRFRARFGNKVNVYHSALSVGERYDTWRQMVLGEPQVVIGTRSAVFAPLPNLGLIILDEEHDSSFKQDFPIPTYHARTVAQWRAELDNCPLILGSATPSLESWLSVSPARTAPVEPETDSPNTTHYLSLPERVQGRPLPPIEIVDMRQELQQGNRSIFSRSLQTALAELKENQQQGILFIHRRGYSTFVSCRSCGYVLECPYCDVSLAYHYTEEGVTIFKMSLL